MIRRAERLGHLLEHHREGAGLGHGACVGGDAVGVGAAALNAVAAEGVDRLRGEPDVAHDRDAVRDEWATVPAIRVPPSA